MAIGSQPTSLRVWPLYLFRLLQAEARDVEFQDHAVMDQSVDGCRGSHRVFENVLPFENGRLLVIITLPRSYRSAKNVNKTSISSRLC